MIEGNIVTLTTNKMETKKGNLNFCCRSSKRRFLAAKRRNCRLQYPVGDKRGICNAKKSSQEYQLWCVSRVFHNCPTHLTSALFTRFPFVFRVSSLPVALSPLPQFVSKLLLLLLLLVVPPLSLLFSLFCCCCCYLFIVPHCVASFVKCISGTAASGQKTIALL